VAFRLDRLAEILQLRDAWRAQVAQVQQMHTWVREAEHILSGEWAEPGTPVTSAGVAHRFDTWRRALAECHDAGGLSEEQRHHLAHFLKVTTHLRPWLVRCYDVPGLPRTDNALEGTIRAIKQRYRRISGRKNWNSYLLRYGRLVAFFEWLAPAAPCKLEQLLAGVGRDQWQAERVGLIQRRKVQGKKHRFRHHRERFLGELEQQWLQTLSGLEEGLSPAAKAPALSQTRDLAACLAFSPLEEYTPNKC
jgi:hypothetical protein